MQSGTDMKSNSLSSYLSQHFEAHDTASDIADGLTNTVLALSKAAIEIAKLSAANGIGASSLGGLAGGVNEDGDSQKQLDVLSDDIIAKAISNTGIGIYYSEEQSEPMMIDKTGLLGLACDPLDGSSNIDTNLTIGTIFSLFDISDCQNGLPPIGRKQLASGLFVYGPQTSLLLSFGKEVAAFGLSEDGQFVRLDWQIDIPKASTEFAINASNAAFWPKPIQDYIYEISYGAGAKDSGMRWLGSLVADSYRIFRRGGVFLYPQDSRKGYEAGRLRLVYEANPIAFLIEAAGGMATTGTGPILDQEISSLHQRIPLIFGSSDEVKKILNYHQSL